MAGGKKKKTKPAANPARGFATTSITSKPKAEKGSDATTSAEASSIGTPVSNAAAVDDNAAELSATNTTAHRELHELSPQELEAQLEESELQQFVEQNGAKVKKETSRQVSRLQTDKRVLRGQADYMSVKLWLPDELMDQIVEMTLHEHQVVGRTHANRVSSDDLLGKVWQLRNCLLDIDVSSERVVDVINYVLGSPNADATDGMSWGLSLALDWLALHCSREEMIDFDTQKTTTSMLNGDEAEDDSLTDPAEQLVPSGKRNSDKDNDTSKPETSDIHDEVFVSDMDSDLEPDELLEVYLRTKARLFQLDPESGRSSKKMAGKATKHDLTEAGSRNKGLQKLQQKLHSVESDVLFDIRDAEARWASLKVDLARQQAERKRLQIVKTGEGSTVSLDDSSRDNGKSNGVDDEAERLGQELLREAEALDDDDVLGGMFDALPGVQAPAVAADDGIHAGSGSVTIRDFGRLTGMNPRRVLEEACKARDSRVKLTYKLVSPTTYASRHSVSIQWTKEQETMDGSWLPVVSLKSKRKSTVITMLEIATPDTTQSEAYVATVAMYLLFASSPKEEKAHLRLPPSYRSLWDEFTVTKREHDEAADRGILKNLRTIIEDGIKPQSKAEDDDEEDDEIVFNATSRLRLNGASGSSTPTSQQESRRRVPTDDPAALMGMWGQKSATPSYQRMLVARKNLPMFHFREEALDTIARHQVTILCGETGCGKSTQLPAFILENELSHGRPCKIYCTEPRRISAMSLAQRVSEEMGERKGDLGTVRSLVGYAIRLEAQTSAETRLVYATVGIVLRMLENSNGLGDTTHLVIDEVHERSIDTDFLLIVLQSLMLRRPELKVVLMSATVDAQKFSSYLQGAPIITVPGRTFPVRAMFLEDAIEITGHTNEDATAPAADDEEEVDLEGRAKGASPEQLASYSKRTRNTLLNYDEYRNDYSLIIKLLEKVAYHQDFQAFSKAILVFLPGLAEIRQVNDMLVGHQSFMKGWRIHPLHSTFSSEEQQAAFDIPPHGARKIVLATNIAETGITIPDVTCVIDTGKHKEMRFDERRQMSRLIQSFIARANAKQRRGRAGRVQEGICFHLFTRYRHDSLMAEQQTPEILRLSLQDLVMRVKICKLGDIEQALSQALDPPSSKNVRRAIDALIEVGALTNGEDLTSLGSQLAKLPLDAQLGKLVLFSSIYGCLDFGLTVAAMLSAKSPFLSPMHAKKQADSVRLGFKRGDSDLLTAYNAYCTWRKVCSTPGLSEYTFCSKNFLSPQNLANIEDIKGQLLTSLADTAFIRLGPDERSALSKMRYNSRHRTFVALPANSCRSDDNDLVANSVTGWAFYPKVIKREGKGWRNIANNQTLGLHPTSVNKAVISPDIKYLAFYSIMQSSSRFTNAQESSPMSDFAMVLLAGEAVFYMYAGVIVIDGNRLRLKVKDWRTMIVLKTLRLKLKEAMARIFKSPGKELGGTQRRWMDILEAILQRQKTS